MKLVKLHSIFSFHVFSIFGSLFLLDIAFDSTLVCTIMVNLKCIICVVTKKQMLGREMRKSTETWTILRLCNWQEIAQTIFQVATLSSSFKTKRVAIVFSRAQSFGLWSMRKSLLQQQGTTYLSNECQVSLLKGDLKEEVYVEQPPRFWNFRSAKMSTSYSKPCMA